MTSADGSPATSGNVNLTPDGAGTGGGRGQIGGNYGSRIEWDGAISIVNVPPGRYVLRARGDDTDVPQFAQQPLTVGGGDFNDVVIALAPAATISGTVSFQGKRRRPTRRRFRITAPSTDPTRFGPNAERARRQGRHVHARRRARGLALDPGERRARLDAEVGDRWTAARWSTRRSRCAAASTLDGDTLVFTDKLTQIAGTVTNQQGDPVTDYTVLAFPIDATLWRPQSRQIMTTRPDQNGKYQLRGLPPGDYYVAMVDPAVQGEWFEPAFLDEQRPGRRASLGEA